MSMAKFKKRTRKILKAEIGSGWEIHLSSAEVEMVCNAGSAAAALSMLLSLAPPVQAAIIAVSAVLKIALRKANELGGDCGAVVVKSSWLELGKSPMAGGLLVLPPGWEAARWKDVRAAMGSA
jgi:hypothetical protein